MPNIAYEGQDVKDLWIAALKSGGYGITKFDVIKYAKSAEITSIQWHKSGMQFRFEIPIKGDAKICHYAMVLSDGAIEPNDNWFVPGDVCFNTFSAALQSVTYIS